MFANNDSKHLIRKSIKREQASDSDDDLTIEDRKRQAEVEDEYEIVESDINTQRKRAEAQKKFKNFPKSIYSDTIKIG